jgi:hypothetical protein
LNHLEVSVFKHLKPDGHAWKENRVKRENGNDIHIWEY